MKDYDPNYQANKQYFLVGGKAVIVNLDNQVLILQRSEKAGSGGKWSLPGGAVDQDEDVLGSIEREITEETELVVKNIQPIAVKTHVKSDHESAIIIGYMAKLVSGEVALNWEHDDFKWVSIDEALTSDLTPDGQYFLEKFKEQTKIS